MEQIELRTINFITPKLPFLFSEEEGGDAKVVKAGLGTDLLLPIRTRLKKCKTRESTGVSMKNFAIFFGNIDPPPSPAA